MVNATSFWNVLRIENTTMLWGLFIALVLTLLILGLARLIRNVKDSLAGGIVIAICVILFFVQGTLLSGAIMVQRQVNGVNSVGEVLLETPINKIVSWIEGNEWEEALNKSDLLLEYVDIDEASISDVLSPWRFVVKQVRLSIIKLSSWLATTWVVGFVLYLCLSKDGTRKKKLRKGSSAPKSYQIDIDF